MAKSPTSRQRERSGYLEWSRDPAVGLFAVLPLWLLYEGLRLLLTPHERNGAELLMTQSLSALGPSASVILRLFFAATVVAAAVSIHKRQVPWARVAMVNALEGTVYGLMLGPLSAAIASSSYRMLSSAAAAGRGLASDLVASLGAGIFEELFFRLFILSVVSLLLVRLCAAHSLPNLIGVLIAVVVSSLAFSLFHHLGENAPAWEPRVFAFRTAAGLILGCLFVFRGFGVCVYTHAMYDVHYYLTHP